MNERLIGYKNLIRGEKKELFEAFRALLLEYNAKYNLTAITEEKEVFYKHFLDSAAGEFLFSKNACVAEIGSGAGFPSV
ncbi:MAG: class I SAM-dependent methyltransferase, partial [Clostridia bacterium]|nr:class I SAM-dependent methyltransferase [Clostridia bacterium]